jgi:hypothetical protein
MKVRPSPGRAVFSFLNEKKTKNENVSKKKCI